MVCRHILQVVLLTIYRIHYYCHWSSPCGGCFEGGLDGTGIESPTADIHVELTVMQNMHTLSNAE